MTADEQHDRAKRRAREINERNTEGASMPSEKTASDVYHELREHCQASELLTELVKKHEAALYGNGRKGVITVVEVIEKEISFLRKWMMASVGFGATTTATLIIGLIIAIVNHLITK